MPVLDRASLEASPLADLHTIAKELGLDGYRRLRKAALVDALVEAHGGEAPAQPKKADSSGDGDTPARSRTRSRSRARKVDADGEDGSTDEDVGDTGSDDEPKSGRGERSGGRERGERGGRGRSRGGRDRERGGRDRDDRDERDEDAGDGAIAEGVVELLGNGSGFLRVSPPEPTDDDVYISAAQVRRCELVSGDTVTGPVRPPRRSERYPSLVRIDTINGRAADEVAEGTHFDDLPAAFPTARFALGGEDATLKAIEWLTPLGRGSRVTVVGAARAGKSEALKRLAAALHGQEGLELTVVLAGVRPEEATEWKSAPVAPTAALTFAASGDAQAQAVERAVDTGKRIAARGGHAVVLVDSLDALPVPAARRALAAARDIVDGGSLTVIATATQPVGGETTVIALDVALTSTGRFPALDLVASGTLRPELLVGDAGADAIAQARAAALG